MGRARLQEDHPCRQCSGARRGLPPRRSTSKVSNMPWNEWGPRNFTTEANFVFLAPSFPLGNGGWLPATELNPAWLSVAQARLAPSTATQYQSAAGFVKHTHRNHARHRGWNEVRCAAVACAAWAMGVLGGALGPPQRAHGSRCVRARTSVAFDAFAGACANACPRCCAGVWCD